MVYKATLATAAMSKLSTIWKNKDITLKTKIRLMRSSVIFIFLYANESWTLTNDIEQRIQDFEMRRFGHILGIDYMARIKAAAGSQKELLKIVRKRKLIWFGHVITILGVRVWLKLLCKGKH